MTANEWVMQFLVGALFGALGQAIRVVAGLKKLNDKAVRQQKPFTDLFSASTLSVSLIIGAVAGVLGVLSTNIDLQAITRQDVVLLIGVGYAGADFIEGFVRKNLPANESEPAPAPARAPAVAGRAHLPPPGPASAPAPVSSPPELELQPPVG